jgi:tetratricopeptide (TPR) repeat protein
MNFMVTVPSLTRVRIVLLASVLTLAAAPAFPAPPQSRGDALAALTSAQTTERMEAVVWLANHGSMADAPRLHERLLDESALVRDYAERALWALWSRSGDAAVDALMARGVDEMQSGDHKAAISTFSDVIGKKPEFAEGWNKRATAHYLAGDMQKSIADCGEVLKRNARHFGALSGLGQIHLQLEDYERSLEWFRKALEVNPNMLGVEFNIKGIERRLKERRGKAI